MQQLNIAGSLHHVEAVAFDFDGTLADTRGAIVSTVAQTLQALGLPLLAEAEVVARIGLPLTAVFQAAGVDATAMAEAIAVYRETFPRHAGRIELFPGAVRLLHDLAARGLVLGIASSRGRASLLALVESLGLSPLVRDVLGDEDAAHKKPAPDLVLRLAQRWSLAPARLLVVGDTSFDIAMGRSAGARTCGVTYGSHDRRQLSEAGADFLVDRLDDLSPLLFPR